VNYSAFINSTIKIAVCGRYTDFSLKVKSPAPAGEPSRTSRGNAPSLLSFSLFLTPHMLSFTQDRIMKLNTNLTVALVN
jgi:hypothetical protein